MIDLLPWPALSEVLSESALLLLFLMAGLLVYGALADQAIFENRGRVQAQSFGRIDFWIAGILAGLLVLQIAGSWHSANEAAASSAALPSASAMIVGVIVQSILLFAIMSGILAGLSARGLKWWEIFGLTALRPEAVLGRAVVLLALALPLIGAALFISQILFSAGGGEDASKQELVRFLAESRSHWAKGVVAVSAILLAPLQEEFLFRGYIYGVARRYAGVPAGSIMEA